MINLAIIMSGGTGSRVGSGVPKQMLKIGGRSLLEMTLEKFHENKKIDEIYVVSHKELISGTEEIRDTRNFFKIKKIIPGGETRQLSANAGIKESTEEHENIMIHDAARPFVSENVIDRILNALKTDKAVTPAIDSPDTLVSTGPDGNLNKYLDRDYIKRVQTPQGFRRDIIIEAHSRAEKDIGKIFTDDCSMIIYYGLSEVRIVEGDPENIKITYREDLEHYKLK